MRVQINGKNLAAKEARQRLQHAGFILHDTAGDYVITIQESEIAVPEFAGRDGRLERTLLERWADGSDESVRVVLERGVPDTGDRQFVITIPNTDTARRHLSIVLEETFHQLLQHVREPKANLQVLNQVKSSLLTHSETMMALQLEIDQLHIEMRRTQITERERRHSAEQAVRDLSATLSLELRHTTDASIASLHELGQDVQRSVNVALAETAPTLAAHERQLLALQAWARLPWWRRFITALPVLLLWPMTSHAADAPLWSWTLSSPTPMLLMPALEGGQVSGQAYDPATNTLRVTCISGCAGGGSVQITDGADTAQVTATAGGSLQVECTSGCGGSGGTSSADGAAYVAGTTSGTPMMGARDDGTPGTVAEDKVGIARITTNRALHSNLRDASGNELGVAAAPVQVSLANTAANATAVKVDGSAVTQPVSGTVTVTDGAGALNVIVDSGTTAVTQGTAANLNATVVGTGTFAVQESGSALTALQLIDDIVYTDDTSTHATGTSKGALLMAAAAPTDASVNANDIGAVAMTTDRKLHVSVQDALPTGSNTIGALTANQSVNVAQINGVTPLMGAGNTGTGSHRVTIATDQAALTGFAVYTEDAGETAGGNLSMVGAVRRDTLASSSGASGDNSTINTTANGALWVSQPDPCSSEAKTTDPISLTTDTVIITAVASKKNYICALVIVAGAAEIVSITEGTGTVCATSEAALVGSTTDANGMSFAANGGLSAVGGNATIIAGKTANVDTCLNVSGSNRVSGFVTWVQR